MKDYGKVRGSKEQAKPLIIGKDTVYVHTDIVDVEDNQCEYNEVQYGKDEYIQLLSESSTVLRADLSSAVIELSTLIAMGGM